MPRVPRQTGSTDYARTDHLARYYDGRARNQTDYPRNKAVPTAPAPPHPQNSSSYVRRRPTERLKLTRRSIPQSAPDESRRTSRIRPRFTASTEQHHQFDKSLLRVPGAIASKGVRYQVVRPEPSTDTTLGGHGTRSSTKAFYGNGAPDSCLLLHGRVRETSPRGNLSVYTPTTRSCSSAALLVLHVAVPRSPIVRVRPSPAVFFGVECPALTLLT